jgi:hypothetical protein
MKITVLHVPGCPSMTPLSQHLVDALVDRDDVEVEDQVVTDQQQAAALHMTGSPTLLVDGVDPFAEPGQQPSISCRLYADDDGRIARAPSTTQLRQALTPVG